MAYTDKNLTCVECGAQFVFSASEQERFASKGYTNEPKRCPSCRESRRASQGGGFSPSGMGRREMFPAVCAQCGQPTQVPFQPRGDRPVYCSECFTKVRASSARR